MLDKAGEAYKSSNADKSDQFRARVYTSGNDVYPCLDTQVPIKQPEGKSSHRKLLEANPNKLLEANPNA